jgi:hypothetical protein
MRGMPAAASRSYAVSIAAMCALPFWGERKRGEFVHVHRANQTVDDKSLTCTRRRLREKENDSVDMHM